mgnify:CR=1 FL=1
MQKHPLKGLLLFLSFFNNSTLFAGAKIQLLEQKKISENINETYLTDDELDLFMLGGIISKTYKDFL